MRHAMWFVLWLGMFCLPWHEAAASVHQQVASLEAQVDAHRQAIAKLETARGNIQEDLAASPSRASYLQGLLDRLELKIQERERAIALLEQRLKRIDELTTRRNISAPRRMKPGTSLNEAAERLEDENDGRVVNGGRRAGRKGGGSAGASGRGGSRGGTSSSEGGHEAGASSARAGTQAPRQPSVVSDSGSASNVGAGTWSNPEVSESASGTIAQRSAATQTSSEMGRVAAGTVFSGAGLSLSGTTVSNSGPAAGYPGASSSWSQPSGSTAAATSSGSATTSGGSAGTQSHGSSTVIDRTSGSGSAQSTVTISSGTGSTSGSDPAAGGTQASKGSSGTGSTGDRWLVW